MRRCVLGEDPVERVWRCARPLLAAALPLAAASALAALDAGSRARNAWPPDGAAVAKPIGRTASIDVLPYFLQGDDRRQEWTLGGHDVLPARDPEGSSARVYVEAKFHSRDFYEVYKVTRNELQLRYEVFRPGGIGGEGNWDDLRQCSIVLSKYGAPGLATGTLGVLGPMRMSYGRSISLVRFLSSILSDFVTEQW